MVGGLYPGAGGRFRGGWRLICLLPLWGWVVVLVMVKVEVKQCHGLGFGLEVVGFYVLDRLMDVAAFISGWWVIR